MLLSSKALVVVPFGLEELLEVGLTIDYTRQRGICASAMVRGRERGDEGVRGEGCVSEGACDGCRME